MSAEPRCPHDHTHDHTHTHTHDPIGLITTETQHLTQAERSRLHFDNFAKLNADKFMEGRRFLSAKLQERLDWIGVDWTKPVRVLDYACGTGMVSHALAPNATPSSQFIGIDVSETMGADKYNATSSTLGFSPTFMKAYKGTLLEPTDPNPSEFSSPEFFNFDLVACSMSLHHFDDPSYAVKQLAKRARPDGGVVLLIDNREEHGGHSHEVFLQATGHKHNVAFGYKEETMKQYHEEAGVGGEFEYVELEDGPHIDMGGRSWDMRVFISKGKRTE